MATQIDFHGQQFLCSGYNDYTFPHSRCTVQGRHFNTRDIYKWFIFRVDLSSGSNGILVDSLQGYN